MARAVLLDSGFLIRLMNPEESLHHVALDVFKKYITSGVVCKVSTIALAEYISVAVANNIYGVEKTLNENLHKLNDDIHLHL